MKSIKKTIFSYVIAGIMGVISFFAAINLRSCVLLIYQIIRANQTQYGGALLNILTVIILMAAWIVYTFYTQYHFEKKCKNKADYINASLKLVLPVLVIFAVTQVFLTFIS